MPLQIGNRSVERVSIIDDDEKVRQGYELAVEDLGLTPVSEAGPLPPIPALVLDLASRTQAAICDHHLTVKNYASFSGAEMVAQCYVAMLPALLCTKWEDASLDDIRPYRQNIPVLLKPSELEPDSIRAGLAHCCEEFSGVFRPSRQAWRTLVRVEDVAPDPPHPFVFVVLSSWNPNEVVRLRLEHLPAPIQQRAAGGARFHARVNLGAEHHSELYFQDWEPE